MVAAIAVAALALALAPAASADFTVNDTGDTSQVTADTICDADDDGGNGNQCTLREAITEAEDTAGLDTITFSSLFDGVAANSTIDTASTNFFSNNPIAINGGDCDPALGAARPCVGINATTGSTPVYIFADGSSVRGIAFSQAGALNVTLLTFGAAAGTVTNSWFGLALDQTVTGCGFGSGIELQGGGKTIGGTTVPDRNVFAGCNTGVDLRTDNNTVQGNYIGTLPDGTIAAGTGATFGIQVAGGPGDAASGNVIGGSDPDTPGACDGPCNLIASSTVAGVTLGTSATSAADNTQVKGNFIGTGPNSTGAQNISGVRVQFGDGNMVGGSVVDRNYFASNVTGLTANAAPTDTTVQGNYFGVDPSGAAAPAPDVVGADLGATAGIDVIGNRFAEGVQVTGGVATLQGNSFGIGTDGEDIGFPDDAIIAIGGSSQIGGTAAGDGNEIGNVDSGIVLSSSSNSNVVEGNAIGIDFAGDPQPLVEEGILVAGNSNRIGGDTAASQNAIVSATDDAIAIPSNTSEFNEIARNTGSAASGTFLDLGEDGFGNATGANGGVVTPTVTSYTSTQISGPTILNGNVRVFKTRTTGGDIRSFLTERTHSTEAFSVPFSPPLGDGQCVTASHTNATNSTSEFTPVVALNQPGCDLIAPTGTITSGPSGLTNDTSPTFGFSSSDAGSTFECRVDAAAFAPCTTPHTVAPLGQGAHTFQVIPTDGPGNVGAPVSRAFTVDSIAPNTGAISGKRKTRRRRPSFRFPTGPAGTTFTCKVDRRKAVPCTSPFKTPRLKLGKHLLLVAARDTAGNVDASPSRRRFKVLKRR